jgi:hypothetical protein
MLLDWEHFERSTISGFRDSPAAILSIAGPVRARETRRIVLTIGLSCLGLR